MVEGLVNYICFNDSLEWIINIQGCLMCLDDEVWVVDVDGNLLLCGEVGCLMICGFYIFCGYYNSL